MKGYTQIGLMTGGVIFFFHLFLMKFNLGASGLLGLQYIILLVGIFISIYLYNGANKLVLIDLFMIGIRTMSSAIIVLLLGVVVLYFVNNGNKPFTQVLMEVVFPFGMSGALSSFVSAIIVNKLLQKT
jgi:hypothetical protein